MRGGWSRIVAAAAGLGAITAAMGLPGTLVGHKGDHAVRVDHRFRAEIAHTSSDVQMAIRFDDEEAVEADRSATRLDVRSARRPRDA